MLAKSIFEPFERTSKPFKKGPQCVFLECPSFYFFTSESRKNRLPHLGSAPGQAAARSFVGKADAECMGLCASASSYYMHSLKVMIGCWSVGVVV